VDATVGHAATPAAPRAAASILGIDRDPDALMTARARLGDTGMTWLEAPYASPAALEAVTAFAPDFILLDLGVSSRQLDADGRGFSFRPGVALDMRMGASGATAADLLNELPEGELAPPRNADERKAGATARRSCGDASAPVSRRATTLNTIRAVLGAGDRRVCQIFQGSVAVNDLADSARALRSAPRSCRAAWLSSAITEKTTRDRRLRARRLAALPVTSAAGRHRYWTTDGRGKSDAESAANRRVQRPSVFR
jgi:16S rRNA (cytosine1402-N4)-methyltransferase